MAIKKDTVNEGAGGQRRLYWALAIGVAVVVTNVFVVVVGI